MQKETLFKQRVMKQLEKIPNIWVEKIQQLTNRGTPDLLICANGHFVAWELKIKGGKVSQLQQLKINQINAAGGRAWIVTPESFPIQLESLKILAEPKFTDISSIGQRLRSESGSTDLTEEKK
jgi:hypothetical protein